MSERASTYRVCVLYSGSTGNATLIETPGARVLIDAGKSAKALLGALSAIGTDIDSIDAVFITHDHRDHISALSTLLKKHPLPVHAVKATAQVIEYGADEAVCACLCCHTPLFCETVGDVTVQSFITPHDSRFSVGYRLTFSDADGREHAIGYATDIGYISEDVRAGLFGCESVVIESNHDREMLMTGPYPRQLKERILSRYGHLANDACAAFAAELAESGCRHLLLAHLSEENNDPTLAYNETLTALGGERVALYVARPDAPVEMRVVLQREAAKC